MTDQKYIPLPIWYQKDNKWEKYTNDHDMDFSSLISSVSISIGGGTGYWCTKCNKRYIDQPVDGFICHNIYTQKVLNKEKLKRLIHDLGEISDILIDRYVDENQTSPEIEEIFNEEKICKTEEEDYCGTNYENFMELLTERYSDQIYDTVEIDCNNNQFVHEKRDGKTIDEHSGDQMRIWNNLLSEKTSGSP